MAASAAAGAAPRAAAPLRALPYYQLVQKRSNLAVHELGITITRDLTPSAHISEMAAKAHRRATDGFLVLHG